MISLKVKKKTKTGLVDFGQIKLKTSTKSELQKEIKKLTNIGFDRQKVSTSEGKPVTFEGDKISTDLSNDGLIKVIKRLHFN